MILASDMVTLVRVNDGAKGATGKGVKTNTRYYCLQASATKPSKPTTNPPDSKWTTTEPSYTMGSTSYLYTVDLTVYTDNNFLYSDVSLSSSYEAAKAAYAKAVNAETEISKTNEEVALKASKNEVTETLKGYATTASMNAAITTKANEITSSVAATYATNASVNLLSGDPSNYSQLNDSTASYWGFTADSTADGHWYVMNNIARDKQVSQWYGCQGGEKLKIECEISTSCKGNTASGGTDSVYLLTRIGIFGIDDSNASHTYTFSDGVTASASAPATAVSSIITIPSSARKFAVFVQTQSWGNFSGTIKVRKLMVSKVNAALDRIASAETRITQNETSIKSKASQTELTGLTTRVNTAEQNIDAAKAQIQLKVSQAEFDNLQIGGINLIPGSKNTRSIVAPATGDSGGNATTFEYGDEYPDKWCRFTAGTNSTTPRALGRFYKVSAGQVYTFSADVKCYGGKALLWIVPLDSSGNAVGPMYYKYSDIFNNIVIRLSVTSESLPSGTNSVFAIIDGITGTGDNCFDTRKWKLEEGNKATVWSPAPEDTAVGGKNLFRGAGYLPEEYWSADSSGATAQGTMMRFVNEDDDTGYCDVTNTNSNFRFLYNTQFPFAAYGTTFTISVKYAQISGPRTFMFQIEPQLNGANVATYAYLPNERALAGGWVLLYKTFTVQNTCDSIRVWLRSGEDYKLYTHEYYIKEPMLEYASTPSEWSRATEDPSYRLKNTVVTIDANGMDVATGGTINFHTSNFNVTPPDGYDQLFSVNAADRTMRAQNGYFDKYLYAPNMAMHATSRYLSIDVGGSGNVPNIQSAWDSLPDVCGEVRFRICGNSPGYAELKGKHVSFLIIESSDTSQMYDVGRVWMWGIHGRASYVTMSVNGSSSDDACRMYCSMFNFENVKFASTGRGLLLFNGSYAFLRYCSITGIGSVAKMAQDGLQAFSSSINMCDCGGVAGWAGISLLDGSFAALKGNTFGPSHYDAGGVIVGNYTIDGTTYDPPAVSTSSTFTASTCVTWQSTYGSTWKKLTDSVGTKVESRHSTTSNGFDYRTGWWVLDTGTAIKSALSGKTISKATVTIKRNDTNSDTRKCHLCYHSMTNTKMNGYDGAASGIGSITGHGIMTEIGSYNLNPSAETVITLPSSVYTKLQDGTIKGFGLVDNATDYRQIMCDNTCTLTVVYT